MSETGSDESPLQLTTAQINEFFDSKEGAVTLEDDEPQVEVEATPITKPETGDEAGRQERQTSFPIHSTTVELSEIDARTGLIRQQVQIAEALAGTIAIRRAKEIREKLSLRRKKRKERVITDGERTGIRKYSSKRVEQYSKVAERYTNILVGMLEAASYSHESSVESETKSEDEQMLTKRHDSVMLTPKLAQPKPHREEAASKQANTSAEGNTETVASTQISGVGREKEGARERQDSATQAIAMSPTSDTSESSDTAAIRKRLCITDLLN
jgi:hypothetical protein